MLEIKHLSVFYGQHRAVEGVSLNVAQGEVVVMLGANGAGKSTLLRAVSGLLPKMAGSAIFLDHETGTPCDCRSGYGPCA